MKNSEIEASTGFFNKFGFWLRLRKELVRVLRVVGVLTSVWIHPAMRNSRERVFIIRLVVIARRLTISR